MFGRYEKMMNAVAKVLHPRGYWTEAPGTSYVYDDTVSPWRYCPWKSYWATFRRTYLWFKKDVKQVFCIHPHWRHCGSGKLTMSLEEVKLVTDALGMTFYRRYFPAGGVPMIRVNHACLRCGFITYRFIADRIERC